MFNLDMLLLYLLLLLSTFRFTVVFGFASHANVSISVPVVFLVVVFIVLAVNSVRYLLHCGFSFLKALLRPGYVRQTASRCASLAACMVCYVLDDLADTLDWLAACLGRRDTYKSKENQCQQLHAQLDQVTRDYDTCRQTAERERQEHRSQLTKSEARVKREALANRAHMCRIETLENNAFKFAHRQQSLQHQVARCETLLRDQEDQMAAMNEGVLERDTVIAALEQEKDDMKTKIARRDREITDLEDDIDSKQITLDKMQNAQMKSERKICTLEAQVAKERAAHKEAREILQQAKADFETYDEGVIAEREEVAQQLDDLTGQLDDLAAEVEAREKENEGLREANAQLLIGNEKLEAALLAHQDASASEAADLRSCLERAEIELEEVKRAVALYEAASSVKQEAHVNQSFDALNETTAEITLVEPTVGKGISQDSIDIVKAEQDALFNDILETIGATPSMLETDLLFTTPSPSSKFIATPPPSSKVIATPPLAAKIIISPLLISKRLSSPASPTDTACDDSLAMDITDAPIDGSTSHAPAKLVDPAPVKLADSTPVLIPFTPAYPVSSSPSIAYCSPPTSELRFRRRRLLVDSAATPILAPPPLDRSSSSPRAASSVARTWLSSLRLFPRRSSTFSPV